MDTGDLPAPKPGVDRRVLSAEEELRIEVSFQPKICDITLQKGSCEIYGVEMPLQKPLKFESGGLKLPLFTWHGCVIDIDCDDPNQICYTSDETNSNISFVNTHAQLEAMRDEAASSENGEGPRVMIVGPTECGKSSFAKVLVAYATKLGRFPLFVDLDPCDNALSVPGTLTVCPMDRQAIQAEAFATSTGIPPGTAAPLVLWHGSTQDIVPNLFRAQVTALGQKIDQRLQTDAAARNSGLIVNTNGWIINEGYDLLLHTVKALRITVVLVLGHDRLYSMMKSSLSGNSAMKIVKVPRSGGVVSRGKDFLRQQRSRSVKRYFCGPAQSLTPYLAQNISWDQLSIYKFASMTLSASLLPVNASAQATESVQLVPISDMAGLQHKLVAVCHPQAVAAYESSQKAAALYESGVAGFCVVEKVIPDTQTLHLLSPCAGSLPSYTLLVGDMTWME